MPSLARRQIEWHRLLCRRLPMQGATMTTTETTILRTKSGSEYWVRLGVHCTTSIANASLQTATSMNHCLLARETSTFLQTRWVMLSIQLTGYVHFGEGATLISTLTTALPQSLSASMNLNGSAMFESNIDQSVDSQALEAYDFVEPVGQR